MNSTKIFLMKYNKECEEEFEEMIINKKITPIILNMITGKQEFMDLSEYNKKGFGTQQLTQRLKITDAKKYPKFRLKRNESKTKAKFIEVKLDDGEREFQIPLSFKRLTEDSKQILNKIEKTRDEVKKGEENSVGIKENINRQQLSATGSGLIKNNNSVWDYIMNGK